MRLYRLLLRLYPASFRHEYGDELLRIFARRREEAGGPLGRLAFWGETAVNTAANAGRVHLDILRQDLRLLEEIRRYTVADSAVWAHPAVAPGALLVKDVSRLICWSW